MTKRLHPSIQGLLGAFAVGASAFLGGCSGSQAAAPPPVPPPAARCPTCQPPTEDIDPASPDQFQGKVAKRYEDSQEWWPPTGKKPPEGAPNVLIILLDDTGFGQIGSFGGLIETPNIDALAQGGLRYTNFHTTALCSPSRASIMAGRFPHSIGLGSHSLTAMGFPGYNAIIPEDAKSVAKVLEQNGFVNYMLGKWDHTPLYEVSQAGPFTRWPSGEGLSALLRVHGRRRRPVPHRHVRGPRPGGALDARSGWQEEHGLPQQRRSRGQGHRLHHRTRVDDRRSLHGLPRARSHALAAPGAAGVHQEVRRQVRRRLGRGARSDPGQADPARHLPQRARRCPSDRRTSPPGTA